MENFNQNRRSFIASLVAGASTLSSWDALGNLAPSKPIIGAHLWVYASKYPPNWDCTPDLEQIFSDLRYAGIEGLEVMHTNLKHPEAVDLLGSLITKYNLPVIGSSYGGDLWNVEKHGEILEEVDLFFEKMEKLKAKNFGISVGDARRKKTEKELDDQAQVLKKIRSLGDPRGMVCNLHNHTYEVINNLHDLKGTLSRIPDFPLGPDLNWLVRGAVDPVSFINQYGNQLVYLHLRDQNQSGVWSEALGEGDMDYVAIASALKKISFKGVATIELAFPSGFKPTRPLRESWKMSREFVKKTFGW